MSNGGVAFQHFGRQLQPRATYDLRGDGQRIAGFFYGEPLPAIAVETIAADQKAPQLREFSVSLEQWPNEIVSARIAPSLAGLGLLEAIPESRIIALADPEDEDNDGISGRVHWVTTANRRDIGRFGWKAPHPTVAAQTADAFLNDIGITSELNPDESCTPMQSDCALQHSGDGPGGDHEINGALFQAVVDFTASIAVPAARPVTLEVKRGKQLFTDIGCHSCHTPSHDLVVNGPTERIWPYTDLLLHDMGPLLADGLAEGDASGGEWRTPPLWALGASAELNPRTGFLHDGRAATVHEAILWHGGEGAKAAANFSVLKPSDQDALAAFVLAL
ncbi:MAG: di-heme oxidoredictase family protein [Pseudomonadota bacterium]